MAVTLIASTSKQGTEPGITTDAIDTTGANLIVVEVSRYAAGGTVTFSDSKGNTWTLLPAQDATFVGGRMRYVISPIVGSGHTFTVSGASTYSSLAVWAFHEDGTPIFGGSAGDKNNSVASGTGFQAGSQVATGASSVFVLGYASDFTGHPTISASFTGIESKLSSGGASFAVGGGYKLGPGTENPLISAWGSPSNATVCATLAWWYWDVPVPPPDPPPGDDLLAAGDCRYGLSTTDDAAPVDSWEASYGDSGDFKMWDISSEYSGDLRPVIRDRAGFHGVDLSGNKRLGTLVDLGMTGQTAGTLHLLVEQRDVTEPGLVMSFGDRGGLFFNLHGSGDAMFLGLAIGAQNMITDPKAHLISVCIDAASEELTALLDGAVVSPAGVGGAGPDITLDDTVFDLVKFTLGWNDDQMKGAAMVVYAWSYFEVAQTVSEARDVFDYYFDDDNFGALFGKTGVGLAFVGDSIAQGAGSSEDHKPPYNVGTNSTKFTTWYACGNNGIETPDLTSRCTEYYNRLAQNRTGLNVAIVIGEPRNRFANSGAVSAATAYSEIVALVDALYAAYDKVLVCTLLPSDALDNTKRAAYNTLVRAGVGVDFDGVVDAAADPDIGDDGDNVPNDFYLDDVHLNDAGNDILSGLISAKIDSFLTPLPVKMRLYRQRWAG